MARYLIERWFPDGLGTTIGGDPTTLTLLVERNIENGVTWLHAYVSEDERTVYCLCDGPDPETVRRASARNGLPVTRIVRVTELSPYAHR